MQIACNFKSSFLAAADDGGDVKVLYHLLYSFYVFFLLHSSITYIETLYQTYIEIRFGTVYTENIAIRYISFPRGSSSIDCYIRKFFNL